MSQRTQFVHAHSSVCPRCGHATLHLRGVCRTCDLCTTMLLQEAALVSQSTESPTESPDIVMEPPYGRVAERVLTPEELYGKRRK